jgi:lipopolysaccharide assembly outer membrane protein LptD (OstA)
VWDQAAETIRSDTPLTLKTDDGSEMQGDQGVYDLKTQVATLEGNIQAQQAQPPGHLRADRMQWDLQANRLEATGTVRYEQPDKGLSMEGHRAVGNLTGQNIQVTGDAPVKTIYTLP